jgi:hypothetical protein
LPTQSEVIYGATREEDGLLITRRDATPLERRFLYQMAALAVCGLGREWHSAAVEACLASEHANNPKYLRGCFSGRYCEDLCGDLGPDCNPTRARICLAKLTQQVRPIVVEAERAARHAQVDKVN